MEPVCAEYTVMMTRVGVFSPISIVNTLNGGQTSSHELSPPFFLLLGHSSYILQAKVLCVWGGVGKKRLGVLGPRSSVWILLPIG